MAGKKRHRRKDRQNPHSRSAPRETRGGEAATIAWTVTVTMLIVCELMGLLIVVYTEVAPRAEEFRPFAGVAQFCALILAVISLILMVIVYRVRRVRPPAGYAAFAGIAAAIPFATAAWNALR